MVLEILTLLIFFEITKRGLILYKNTKLSLELLKNREMKNKIHSEPYVIILIPVLSEHKIIQDTIEYFSKINYPNKQVYIITSENEYLTAKENKENTIDIVKRELKRFKNIRHIHCPYRYGNKAVQLNYAIKNINLNSKTIIAIYDADSRPELDTFYQIEYDEKTTIFQQFSLYFNSYDKLSSINKAGALLQTRWSLGYELPIVKNQYENFSKKGFFNKVKSNLIYCIGHGLIIRKDKLDKLGLFCEDTLAEDIHIGYKASLLGERIKPIYTIDNVQYAANTKSSIIQSSRWFGGEMSIFKVRKKLKVKSFISDFLICKRIYYLLYWIFGPISYLVAIIILFHIKSIFLFAFSIISAIIYIVPSHILLLKNFGLFEKLIGNRLDKINYIKIIPLVYLKSLINCLGPIYYFYQYIKYRIIGQEHPFIRTEKLS